MERGSTQNTWALRRLLVLARDFLQASDLTTVLELAGQAIPELLRSDGSLLLVQSGEREYVTEFGHQGTVPRIPQESELLRHARRAMHDRTPILLPDIAPDTGLPNGEISALGAASLIAYPFPSLLRCAW